MFTNKQKAIKQVKSIIQKIEGDKKSQTTGLLDQMTFLKRELNTIVKEYSDLLNEGLYKKLEISGGAFLMPKKSNKPNVPASKPQQQKLDNNDINKSNYRVRSSIDFNRKS